MRPRVVWAAAALLAAGCVPVTEATTEPSVQVPTAVQQPAPSSTETTTGPGGCLLTPDVVTVELDPVDHAAILDHIGDAIAEGHPDVLTIERDDADQRRDAATDDYPTRDGHDRDEYPPAMSAEGGEGSSVRHIDSSENRSAGAVMGNQLDPYCDTQRFRIEAER